MTRFSRISGVNAGAIVLTLLFISGWSTKAQTKTTTVTEANNGKTLRLCAGDELVVRLPVQLGTGYSWHIVKNNRARLRPQDPPKTTTSTAQTTGGQEFQEFRFRAKAKGVVRLQLNYLRVWEKDKPPAKSFRLKVRIC